MRFKITLLLFFIGILNVNGQNKSWNTGPKYIIAYHGGFCSGTELSETSSGNSYLKTNDTTLIPFNEHSTFEDRLNLKSIGLMLDTGYYEVLFIDNNLGRMDSAQFYIDSYDQTTDVEINYDFYLCFQGINTNYIHFDSTSLTIIDSPCNNIDSIYSEIMSSNSTVELTGITWDNCSEELANQRALKVYALLTDLGVPESKLKIQESVNLKSILSRNTFGHFIIYPPDDNDCFLNNTCQQGVRIVRKTE